MNGCNKDKNINVNVPIMHSFSQKEIKDVLFLYKISLIQRLIYRKAISECHNFKDAQLEVLVELSRSALYNACTANRILLNEDETLYNKRNRYFKKCLNDLFSMQRPIYELIQDDVFNENDIEKLCELLTDSIKLIKSVIESDKKRHESLINQVI